MSDVIVGVGGVKRNAAAAVFRGGALASVCEEGRVTRVRDVGMRTTGFPQAAVTAALQAAGSNGPPGEIVAAEQGVELPDPHATILDHHLAHAATAFLTSPFDEAVIVVCDTDRSRELTVWRGAGSRIEEVPIGWQGAGFARLYSWLTGAMGFEPGSDEYAVEALARLDGAAEDAGIAASLQYRDMRVIFDGVFEHIAATRGRDRSDGASARLAGVVQRRIGELIVEFLEEVRRRVPGANLCLAGGLFFNTYLNTVVKGCHLFEKVFIPVNPGNAGLAAGCALARGYQRDGRRTDPRAVSPFLGPEYTNEEIKAVLDNCKLSYDFLDDSSLIRRVVEGLRRGELIGWFRGRLEWGTRALGNRSIFANPFVPYVLENLNRFLKHREPYRTYGLAVCEEEVGSFFRGPAASRYMECEYEILDRVLFGHVSPPGIERIRVQTVADEPVLLRQLLLAFGQAGPAPILINTSFNGFHEPIVCSPRDAVRVFYGTGLDMLIAGNFVLRK